MLLLEIPFKNFPSTITAYYAPRSLVPAEFDAEASTEKGFQKKLSGSGRSKEASCYLYTQAIKVPRVPFLIMDRHSEKTLHNT